MFCTRARSCARADDAKSCAVGMRNAKPGNHLKWKVLPNLVFPLIWGENGGVLSMRMQVILDSSFARPGSAPLWGGKKGEFRDWTRCRHVIFCTSVLIWHEAASHQVCPGAIIGDGDRKSWDPRGPMIWDNFSIFRTNCAILTSCIRADPRTCRGLSRGCCHVA